jgi:hypothetical protein
MKAAARWFLSTAIVYTRGKRILLFLNILARFKSLLNCDVYFFPLAQVNFWVNGGWDQPNCGFAVNTYFYRQLGRAQSTGGKNTKALTYCMTVIQNLYSP